MTSASGLDAVVHKYQPHTASATKARVNTMYEKLDHTQFNADLYQTKVSHAIGIGSGQTEHLQGRRELSNSNVIASRPAHPAGTADFERRGFSLTHCGHYFRLTEERRGMI